MFGNALQLPAQQTERGVMAVTATALDAAGKGTLSASGTVPGQGRTYAG
jgi:hypothetical protein